MGLIPENELSGGMGVELNPITSGPRVNESLETNIEGVFACGNVLHVHDLVDFVSEEAKAAGRNAAVYVQNSCPQHTDGAKSVSLKAESGVRYTVPEKICPERMDDQLKVRFRVGNVYKNCYISVYFDDKRIIHKKKAVVAPGEMEEVVLTKKQLLEDLALQTVIVKLEEA